MHVCLRIFGETLTQSPRLNSSTFHLCSQVLWYCKSLIYRVPKQAPKWFGKISSNACIMWLMSAPLCARILQQSILIHPTVTILIKCPLRKKNDDGSSVEWISDNEGWATETWERMNWLQVDRLLVDYRNYCYVCIALAQPIQLTRMLVLWFVFNHGKDLRHITITTRPWRAFVQRHLRNQAYEQNTLMPRKKMCIERCIKIKIKNKK